MRLKTLAYTGITAAVMAGCHGNKYSGIKIDSMDVEGYVQAYTIFDDGYKDFLLYINDHTEADTTQIKNYDKIMYILGSRGFPDIEYFMYVHGKLSPVVAAIAQNPGAERYPGIGTADLSFMEAGQREYRKHLDDTTLSEDKKNFYREQMSQIETTMLDIMDKREKNEAWLKLIRENIDPSLELTDNDIMQLTILENEISHP